jgi:hypothetical protein
MTEINKIDELERKNKDLKMELENRFLQVNYLLAEVKGLEIEKKRLQRDIDGWVTTNQELVSVYSQRNETLRNNFLSLLRGIDIAELIDMWAKRNNIHPDDLDSMFVPELLEQLEDEC